MGPFLKSTAQEHRHLAKSVRGWYFFSPFVMLTLHQGSQTMGQALSLQINFHYTLLKKKDSICWLGMFWSMEAGLSWLKLVLIRSYLRRTSLRPAHDQFKPAHNQLITSLNQLKPSAMLQNIPNQHMLFFSTGQSGLNVFKSQISAPIFTIYCLIYIFQICGCKNAGSLKENTAWLVSPR